MAWNKIGSGQLKDGAVLAQHIGAKEIEATHIADKAIKEAHLDIDWTAKASDILSAKKVVDYVQASAGTIAAGSDSITLTGITLAEAATDADLGVIVNGPNNKVILSEKNDAAKLLVDPTTGEVIFGRMATGLEVSFFIVKEGVETAYTFADAVEYNLQFPARFTLETVSEMFAANEKFVDGVADVATRLDVAQLVADIFGTGYTLNKNGQPALASGQTISEVLAAVETLAEQNATDVESVELVLHGTTENPTTGLVSKVTVVEGKIADLETLALNAGDTSGLETRIKSLEDETLAVRLKAIEDADVVNRLDQLEALGGGADLSGIESRLDTHEATIVNVQSRLSTSEAAITALQNATQPILLRVNKKADVEVSTYNLQADLGINNAYAPYDGAVDVYVNGMLQMVAEHYTEVSVDGVITDIDFNPNVVKVGDVVQLRWMR